MVRSSQTICQQQPTNCLSVFDHFVGLALKGLISIARQTIADMLLIELRINFKKSIIHDNKHNVLPFSFSFDCFLSKIRKYE